MDSARLPADAPAPQEPPQPFSLSPSFWSALLRVRRDVQAPGVLRHARLTPLAALGVDRYEVKAQFTRMGGMIDERIWLVTRDELGAVCAMLDDGDEKTRLGALVAAR